VENAWIDLYYPLEQLSLSRRIGEFARNAFKTLTAAKKESCVGWHEGWLQQAVKRNDQISQTIAPP